jgi:hypothetical protein
MAPRVVPRSGADAASAQEPRRPGILSARLRAAAVDDTIYVLTEDPR